MINEDAEEIGLHLGFDFVLPLLQQSERGNDESRPLVNVVGLVLGHDTNLAEIWGRQVRVAKRTRRGRKANSLNGLKQGKRQKSVTFYERMKELTYFTQSHLIGKNTTEELRVLLFTHPVDSNELS